MAINLNKAIEVAQLVQAAAAIPPGNLGNSAGTKINASGTAYTVVTTIYANDLVTDMNPSRGTHQVSIGLIWQADISGDVVIAIRGTDGIFEWFHDFQFGLVPCPFLVGAGHVEDGFAQMYNTLRTGTAPGAPRLADALAALPFALPVGVLTISGHSLGAALATLLGLDVAANTTFNNPTVYTYASPRTGDPLFASTFNSVIKNKFRVSNRLDIVTKVPLIPAYAHVDERFSMNPTGVKLTIPCEHDLLTYLHLLSVAAGVAVIPLGPGC